MSFIHKIQQVSFWKNFLKVFIPFFLVLIVVMLLINSLGDIFSGEFANVYEKNFSEGKWIRFFTTKFVISFFYSLWMTTKNTK